MKNIVLSFLLLIGVSGCTLIDNIETISDHIDDTTNPNSLNYNNFNQFKNSDNTPVFSDNHVLKAKRKYAIDMTARALKWQGRSNHNELDELNPQKKANSYLTIALKAALEYKKESITYNSYQESELAMKAFTALAKAKSYQKLNNFIEAERKIKYAYLLLVNNQNALWLWQQKDNQTFPDYLKWDDSTMKHSSKIVEHPDSLVFSGGGVKGTSYAGILEYLNESGKLKHIKRFAGTSAGVIMCAFSSIGDYYNTHKKSGDKPFWKVVYDLAMDYDFIDFIDNPKLRESLKKGNFSPYTKNLINSTAIVSKQLDEQYALCSGDKLTQFFQTAFENFGIDKNITLKELHKLTGKHLVLVACSLSYRKVAYFDYKSAPNMKVIDGIRASMAIPFIFKPVKYNNDFFVDGGAVNNFPINYFDESIDAKEKPVTLGFILYSKKEILRPEWRMLKNPVDYAGAVADLLMVNTGSALFKKNVDRTVFIDCGDIDVMSFDMTKKQKINLIQAGYDSARKYFEPDYNKIHQAPSLKAKEKEKEKAEGNKLSWYVFYPELIFVSPPLANIYGINLGLPLTNTNNIYGVQLSLLSNNSKNVYGIQMSTLFNNNKNITGISVAFMNNTKNATGLTVAFVNNANNMSDSYNCQLAVINNSNNEANDNILQLAVINRADNDEGILRAGQIGLINMIKAEYTQSEGMQLGIINSSENFSGIQIGIFNKAETAHGIQIGLLNKMDNGLLPYFPFFNLSYK